MRVFLTGGTGLLGSHVAERLRGGGHEVVALYRAGSDTGFLDSLGCSLTEGHLEDSPHRHAEAMEGCQGLVHAAARLYGGRSLEAVRAINVTGTARLLEGAALAGSLRVVHISSVAVYGNPPCPMAEDHPLKSPLGKADFYGRTKREGELLAGDFHGKNGLDLTVLRPPAMYGERDRFFSAKVAAFLRRRFVVLLGGGRTRMAAVYAGNVAQAVELALKGRGAGQIFNVTEDFPLTQRELFEGLGRELGLNPTFLSVPGFLARAGARVADAAGLRVSGVRGLSLARVVRLSVEDNPYPARKAREILGWDPPYSKTVAMARTGRWLKEEEAVDG